jgi:hypothetical protein
MGCRNFVKKYRWLVPNDQRSPTLHLSDLAALDPPVAVLGILAFRNAKKRTLAAGSGMGMLWRSETFECDRI